MTAHRSPSSGTAVFGACAQTAWRLKDGRVDLAGRASRPRLVPLAAEPQPLTVDLARSVLVVVDMQNDFCHRDGWFGQKGVSLRGPRRVIPVIASLLPVWRAAGGRVLWLNWGVRADRLELPALVQFKGKRSGDGVGYAERSPRDHGPSLVPGHWGADVVAPLVVEAPDVVVHKHRLSGFWDNELDSMLRGLGATTLFYAGVNTDRCVFSTLQDAGFLGYANVLVTDACATSSPVYVERAIHFMVRQLHGFTVTGADLQAALAPRAKAPARRRSVQPGESR